MIKINWILGSNFKLLTIKPSIALVSITKNIFILFFSLDILIIAMWSESVQAQRHRVSKLFKSKLVVDITWFTNRPQQINPFNKKRRYPQTYINFWEVKSKISKWNFFPSFLSAFSEHQTATRGSVLWALKSTVEAME